MLALQKCMEADAQRWRYRNAWRLIRSAGAAEMHGLKTTGFLLKNSGRYSIIFRAK